MYLPVMSPLRDFFSEVRWNGKPVVTVFGAPDRAHSEAARAFKSRMQGKLTRQQIEDSPTPVPFISIWRSMPTFDPARHSRAEIRGINVDRRAGTALKMRFPRSMQSDVQVDLWCGEAGGKIAEVIAAQTEMFFPNESVYLPIDWTLPKWYRPPFDVFEHAKLYGRTRGHLVQTQGWVDNTNLEFAEGGKEVRLTWSGRYDFYIPYRAEEGRIVRELAFDIFDELTGDLLDSLNLGLED
jgi:hypothetical protein